MLPLFSVRVHPVLVIVVETLEPLDPSFSG